MTDFAAAGTAALLGALFALDDAVCVSLLLSEPVFAGALFGAATGRFESGVACGALLQCVWMAGLRVGGARPPEAWLGALVATSAAPAGIVLGDAGWAGGESLTVALLLGIAAAYGGAWVRALVTRVIAHGADRAIARAGAGDLGAITRLQASAVLLHAGRGAFLGCLLAGLAGPVGAALAPLLPAAPAGWIALALGCAALVQSGGRAARWMWAAGGIAGLLWAWT